MSLVTTDAPSEELITVDAAKRHLRIMSSDKDDEVAWFTAAARRVCEAHVSRTLRSATTRIESMCFWPCLEHKLPYPPLIDITEIKYYDADDVDTVLDDENYHVVLSTDGVGKLVWAADASLPTVSTRPDAIRIEYTAGYESLPEDAKAAILLTLETIYGEETDPRRLELCGSRARWLLDHLDWGSYA